MMNKIEAALRKLFEKHDLIFWYDERHEMRETFEALDLENVTKLEIKNNSFGIKYHIFQEEKRNQKFLLYFDGEEPEMKENWLLDLQLANTVFKADKISAWLAEMALPESFRSLLEAHAGFFQSTTRREALKQRLNDGDSQQTILRKMMASCLGNRVEANLEDITIALLAELAEEKDDKYQELEKFGLLKPWFKGLQDAYDYASETSHIEDFAFKLFESGFQRALHGQGSLNQEALILLNKWQGGREKASYEQLGKKIENLTHIDTKLSEYRLEALIHCDVFQRIDVHFLNNLMEKVLNRAISPEELSLILRERKSSHWFKDGIANAYYALEKAVYLLAEIKAKYYDLHSLEEGFNRYLKDWWRIDQLYREYLFFMGKSEKLEFFARLNDEVEKQYVNNYLTPASNNWQRVIDKTESWVDLDFKLQRNFFKDHVKETLDSGGKLAVVISDGLRYEVAEALSRDIEGEGRFECDLDWMVGSLPSYTALGMAALLPNKELMIHTDGSVKVDGQSSAGLENRNLVLSSGYPKASKAMLASDYKRLNTDDRRALIRNHHVLYLYHNRIDAIADKRESEDETVDAVDMAIQEIVDLVKSLYGGNVNKIIMTTDHGFMYQNQKLEDTDLNSVEVSGKEIYLKKRRFIVGKELENNNNVLKHFSAKQLGLAGDYEVLLAKSVNRIRVSGAGMQYVHGGSSLQEIVLPVLTVSVKKTSAHDTRLVDVDRIESASSSITTGQLGVNFIQKEKVSGKVLPRTLRVGIYAEDGTLISDTQDLFFGSESDNQRDWEVSVRLMLSDKSYDYNLKPVYLRLEERIKNTEYYTRYNEWRYELKRTIGFDF